MLHATACVSKYALVAAPDSPVAPTHSIQALALLVNDLHHRCVALPPPPPAPGSSSNGRPVRSEAQSGVGDESGGDPRWPPHLFYYLAFLPFLAFFSLGTTLAGVRYEPDALRAMPPMLAPTGGLKLPDSGSSL